MNWVEMVLLITVCTGILEPCLTVAFSLFCVITLGLESSLPTPLASAAEMMKSRAKFGELCAKEKPLVGARAPNAETSGMAVLPEETRGGGGRPGPRISGLTKPAVPGQ